MKKFLIGFVLFDVLVAIFIATRPSEVRVERSTTIQAPAATVLGVVADFHQWSAWSPWAKLDPAQKEEFSGAASGVGAKYHWKGNDKVGEGRMEITSVTPTQVKLALEFLQPFHSLNEVDFTATPAGDGVTFTWGMTAHQDFMGKAFGVFMDMDKMVGKDFERGLSQLKSVSEASARKVISPIRPAAATGAPPPAP
jgi:hypothetical protein